MDKRNFVGVGFSLMKCRSVFLKVHKITFPLYYIHAMALLVKDLTAQENCNELFTGKKKLLVTETVFLYIQKRHTQKETDSKKILPLPNPPGPQSSLLVTPP